jgi:hypothetical protein
MTIDEATGILRENTTGFFQASPEILAQAKVVAGHHFGVVLTKENVQVATLLLMMRRVFRTCRQSEKGKL